LDLRGLVMARLQGLVPEGKARLFRDQLVTLDDRALLLLLEPKGSGIDSAVARRLRATFATLETQLASPAAAARFGGPLRVTAVGGYRAALDNEEIVRGDVQVALVLTTLGIALLLLLCFPRPLLGLLSLVPAAAGVAAGLLLYSLLRPSISAMALGFGGALVSITVDQGIAYLLCLDRGEATTGRAAAQQVWSVGLLVTATTAGAFWALRFSGYPLLEQLGLFAALSVLCAFVFVHSVFPFVFPRVPAAARAPRWDADRLLRRATQGRGLRSAALAGLACLALVPFVQREVSVSLDSMNTVRPETLAAEQRIRSTWGDVMQQVYLMQQAASPGALQTEGDRVAEFVAEQEALGRLSPSFSPAGVRPGAQRAAQQHAAWRRFFDPARRAALERDLGAAAADLGFAPDAFAPFLRSLTAAAPSAAPLPPALYGLFGLAQSRDGASWLWLGSLRRGPAYDGAALAAAAAERGLQLFDASLFSQRLAAHLSHAFLRMLGIVGALVATLLLLLLADLRLALLAALPLVFALVVSLAGLRLLGQPIDIPALMLGIVVFGMGVDYSLYLLRSAQEALDEGSPRLAPMRLTVFLAAGSTLMGMAGMVFARHSLLRSAGSAASLAVLASAGGAFLLLPPFLRRLYGGPQGPAWAAAGARSAAAQVRRRYRFLAAGPRLFARFKLQLDPMFPRLAELAGPATRIFDLGCGWGVPAAWLLAQRPTARVYALEPAPERARVARWVLAERGEVVQGAAPALPPLPPGEAPFDLALALDVLHHLDDAALAATLTGLHARLRPGGRVLLRLTVPSRRRGPWERWLEAWRLRAGGRLAHFRSAEEVEAALHRAGFVGLGREAGPRGREETWFWAERPAPSEATP